MAQIEMPFTYVMIATCPINPRTASLLCQPFYPSTVVCKRLALVVSHLTVVTTSISLNGAHIIADYPSAERLRMTSGNGANFSYCCRINLLAPSCKWMKGQCHVGHMTSFMYHWLRVFHFSITHHHYLEKK